MLKSRFRLHTMRLCLILWLREVEMFDDPFSYTFQVSVCAGVNEMNMWESFVSGIIAGPIYMIIHYAVLWCKSKFNNIFITHNIESKWKVQANYGHKFHIPKRKKVHNNVLLLKFNCVIAERIRCRHEQQFSINVWAVRNCLVCLDFATSAYRQPPPRFPITWSAKPTGKCIVGSQNMNVVHAWRCSSIF